MIMMIIIVKKLTITTNETHMFRLGCGSRTERRGQVDAHVAYIPKTRELAMYRGLLFQRRYTTTESLHVVWTCVHPDHVSRHVLLCLHRAPWISDLHTWTFRISETPGYQIPG